MTCMTARIAALTVAASFAAALTATAQDRTAAAEHDRSMGRLILDGVEAGLAAEKLARKVRDKANEIRREWTGDPAPAEEAVVVEEAPGGKDKTGKRGGGPPDWAPAHGWRAKFGEQEETDLGRFAGKKVDEGLSGDELVIAIRGEVDRISKGEDTGDEARSKGNRGGGGHGDHDNDDGEEDDDAKGRGSSPGKKGDKGKGRN